MSRILLSTLATTAVILGLYAPGAARAHASAAPAPTRAQATAGGGPVGYALGTEEHTFYLGADGHVHELWFAAGTWHRGDVTVAAGAPPARAGSPLAHYIHGSWEVILYLGTDSHVQELWLVSGAWRHVDLTAAAGAPPARADSALAGYVMGAGEHVVYESADNHVQELWLAAGTWHRTDLTAAAGAPPARVGSPLAHYSSGSREVILYLGADSHVHEMWFVSGTWRHTDLTATAAAPLASPNSALVGYATGGGEYAVYESADNHVQQLWFASSAWHHGDLTVTAGAPAARAGSPLVHYIHGSWDIVLYVGADNDVHELWFVSGTWRHTNLTATAGAPPVRADSALAGYVMGAGEHVLYIGTGNHVQELWFASSTWHRTDLTMAAGAPPVNAAGMPARPAITVTPATTNRGGAITISGVGFAPNEAIDLTISGANGVAAVVRADAVGVLMATGLGIPYSLPVGGHTITATGVTSKRAVSAAITVAPLSPSISLSASAAAPGTTETVRGKGFGTAEQVTLSLNGEALPTTPAVITTTNGAFTATFTVPQSALNGANSVSAIGNQSRVNAVASLTGNLAQTAQFYFAGAINTARQHSYVDLLNTNKHPARVHLAFYFNTGATYTADVTVNATSQKRVAVATLGNYPEGTYGLIVKSDRPIAAQIVTERNGMDGAVMLGRTAPDTHWYLAAGATKGTFHETVSIFNPDPTLPTGVQLQLVGASNMAHKAVMLTVPAHTNDVVNVNALFPGQATVGVIAISSRPVVVERTLSFGPNKRGLTMLSGARKASTTWLFADGTTENGVQTRYSILNPGDQGAQVTASFSQANGHVLGSTSVYVPARSRSTLNLANVVHGGGIAAVISSNQPVVVERAEYIGSPDKAMAASAVLGRNGGAPRWSFPGGNTTPGRAEVLDLYNPSAVTIPVKATLYMTDGKVVSRQYTLTPTARVIIPINALAQTTLHGAVLESGNGQGFIAEQGISVKDSHLLRATQGLAQ